MKHLMRFIAFILKNIIWICVAIALCAAGFFISMNYSSLDVMLNDGLKERANVILYNNDTSSMSQYFTNYFMETDSYLALREQYGIYEIKTFGYNLQCGSLMTWPWATTATVYVDEAVYSIDGAIDTTIKDKDAAMLDGTYYPPAWKNCRYKVTLIKSDGQWKIEKLEYVSEYNYVQPTQRSLPPEVLASLRPTPTPVPSPTATPIYTDTPQPTYKGIVRGVEDRLNVRSGPGTNYDKIGELKEGDTVVIYTLNENWYCIDFNGTKAYVHKQYIEFEETE